MATVERLIQTVGLVFAFLLLPVGVFNLLFSASGIVAYLGVDRPVAAWAVLFAIGIAHLVPALLFAWQLAQGGTKGMGLAMVAYAPLIGWTGFDALVLHGDWGDAVIWLPYLATGICLLLLGIISLARRIA